jgi:NADH:ubiquinone oxidoreductase subunit 2 (subunit N)
LEFIKTISPYINPAAVFASLIFGIIILLFFGISKREWIKKFSFVLTLTLFLFAFFINIFGYRVNGDYSNSLFTSGAIEIFEIAIILFFSLVCLSAIFIYNRKNDHFVKIVMVFLFLVISVLVIIISKNFISFFVSLICFLISFFSISTILNGDSTLAETEVAKESKIILGQASTFKSVTRFFITSLFFTLLLFFGFSILYGISDVKNFLALYQAIEQSGINIILSLIIISIAFYIYLGIFPFQAPYISFANKAEPSSVYLLWLFYFPAGILALLKFIPIISILNKNLKAGSYILYLLLATVFLSSIGSGIAGLKTKSIKKMASYFFSLMITGYFINMILLISGFIKEDRLNWLNIFYLLFIGACFLPVAFIFSYIVKAAKKDNTGELVSLIYKNKLIGIVYLISLLSLIGIPGFFGWTVKKYYFDVIVNIFNSANKGLPGLQGWLILIILIVYFISFTAICLRLIIIVFMKQSREADEDINLKAPKVFYILICFFAVLMIFLGIIGLLETLNPDISYFGIRITNSVIFIKNL